MEKIYYNIDQMGIDTGLPKETVDTPFGTMEKVVWNGEGARAVCEEIKRSIDPDEAPIGLSGSAPMWVMTAAVEAIFPAKIHFHPGGGPAPKAGSAPKAAPEGAHAAPPPQITLELHNLSFGEYVPEGDCEFVLTREGKRVFIDFIADKPDKPQLYGGGHHSYNPDLLPLVKCPAVEPDDDVFLSGAGSFNIIESIATAYFGKCRSIWVPATNPKYTGEFFCAVSYGKDAAVGDKFKK